MHNSNCAFLFFKWCYEFFNLTAVKGRLVKLFASLPKATSLSLEKLQSPEANLVVEPTCETHDGLGVGGVSKRSQNGRKMGVVKPKGIFLSKNMLI